MKLVVVSHTEHFQSGAGPMGWGPTVREIDHLARLFDEVAHVAPVVKGDPPATAKPYSASNVRLRPLHPSGGSGLAAKSGVLARWPSYAEVILSEANTADVVHVRGPANVALLALLISGFLPRHCRRWFKYAGSWAAYEDEPISYRLQRLLLRHGFGGGSVTVNGRWPDQPAHVHSFINPCLTAEELLQGRGIAESKRLEEDIRLLFVGRLEREKGAGRAIEILERLQGKRVPATLDLVGDGRDRAELTKEADARGLSGLVRFHGWLGRDFLPALYRRAHLQLLPSTCSEGWPKVLSEGMAYGVVPLASRAGSISQVLREFNVGRALDALDVEGFASAVAEYAKDDKRWRREALAAARHAVRFGYEAYLDDVRQLLELGHRDGMEAASAQEGQVGVEAG